MFNSKFRFSDLKHWQAASFLLFSTLVLFWNFLSPTGHLILSKMGEDLSGQFVWWRQFGFDELKKGHLVLWNPHLFCGEPYFGGFQSALLYPPNWLFMVLPLPFAINTSIALHVFLAGFFTYSWIRFRGSHPASALMSAFMFMLGASMILHVVPGHLPNLCTMAWIPLVFLSVDICYRKKEWHWILFAMFALSMQIFSGHIQYVYYTAVIISFYVLFLLAQIRESKGIFFLKFALIGLGAAALSAVQLLAGWAATAESTRARVLDIDFIDIADITPERFCCLLMPNFFDGWKTYWGGGFYWEGPVFVSVTAFVLGLWALFVSKQKDKTFFSLLALILALIGVGKRTPLFALFCKYFPLFSSFRGVGKLNIFITLSLVVLAALGMDEVFKNPEKLLKLKSQIFKAAGLFLLAALVFYTAPLLGGRKLFKNFIDHAGSMTWSLSLCAATLVLIALIAWISAKRPLWRYGFLVMAFAELFIFAKSNLPFFDLDDLRREVNTIQVTYQQDPGDYRVYSGENDFPLGTSGLGAWGNDPFAPSRYNEYLTLTQIPRGHLNEPLHNYPKSLSLARLKYAFYEQGNSLIRQKLDLPKAPRAFLVNEWKKSSLETIWPLVFSPSFNQLKQVWLEQDPGIACNPSMDGGVVEIKDLSTDAVEINAETPKPAILVLSDNYSKDWKAIGYPDSSQTSYLVMPANGFQKAIPLEAGKHHIFLEYRPTAFVLGCWISCVSWILFIVCFFLTKSFIKR